MEPSLFIAQLLGPFMAVVGIALIARPQYFRDVAQEFFRSPALLFLGGIVGFVSGLAIVLTHNIWVPDWRIIISLIGWVTLVRSLVHIFRPQWIVNFAMKMMGGSGVIVGAGAFDLVLGLVLSYYGYLA